MSIVRIFVFTALWAFITIGCENNPSESGRVIPDEHSSESNRSSKTSTSDFINKEVDLREEQFSLSDNVDLDDPETRHTLTTEAIDRAKLLSMEIDEEKLSREPGQEVPYTGWVKQSYENGEVMELASFKMGRREGLAVKWHANGQKMEEVNYLSGKRNGLFIEWHDNGRKAREGRYENGKQEGPCTRWHDNGVKSMSVAFSKGSKNGLCTFWHENGQKESEGTYKKDRWDGLFTKWYENGRKKEEMNYLEGKLEGMWISYEEDGEEHYRTTYRSGKMVSDRELVP